MSQSQPADPLPALVQDADRTLDAAVAEIVMGATWSVAEGIRKGCEWLRFPGDRRTTWNAPEVLAARGGLSALAMGLGLQVWPDCPRYSSDWSAIRLVEDEIERLGLMDDYAWRLEELVAADNAKRDHYAPAHVNMLRASCEQRCKAALAVCGALHDRRTDA